MTETLQAGVKTGSNRRHPARQKALQPYLDKLRGWIVSVSGTDPDRSAKINVGTRVVTLEGWDREQLAAYFRTEESGATEFVELVAHCVAQVLKATFDVERLKRDQQAGSGGLYALQAELMLDTALGMALLDETQVAIDGFVQSGRVLDAKALTQFRHQIKHAISEAKKQIAASELAQAEALSRRLGDRLESQSAAEPPRSTVASIERSEEFEAAIEDAAMYVDRPTGSRPGKGGKARPGALPGPINPVEFPSMNKMLAVILAGVTVLFVFVVVMPMLLRYSPPRLLRSDLPNAEKFIDIQANAPSVYATVEHARWEQMDLQSRRRMIDDLGQRVGGLGFSGAELRTTEGRPVARWLSSRGYELIEHEEVLQIESVGY